MTVTLNGWTRKAGINLLLPYKLQPRSTFATKILTPSISLTSNSDLSDAKCIKGKPNLSQFPSNGRPLVIMPLWYYAKVTSGKPYRQLYLNRGYDVLALRIKPLHGIFPARLDPTIKKEIIPALFTSNHETKFLHGFSIGGLIWARTFEILRQKGSTDASNRFLKSVKCQIWDSVPHSRAPAIGISTSIFSNVKTQQRSQRFIEWYMTIFYHSMTKHYDEAWDNFCNQPIKVPALLLGSETDPVCTKTTLEHTKKCFTKLGLDCTSKVWKDSRHILHMKKYPEEYQAVVAQFLNDNNIAPCPPNTATGRGKEGSGKNR